MNEDEKAAEDVFEYPKSAIEKMNSKAAWADDMLLDARDLISRYYQKTSSDLAADWLNRFEKGTKP